MNIEVVSETRFAVVMYGGVSLAIYINGVTQELLKMVRATAVKDGSTEFLYTDRELSDGERVYRDISYLIADSELLDDRDLLEEYGKWLGEKGPKTTNPLHTRLATREKENKVRKVARFVVDILSGSSAGGINGVYLAKALAGGQKLDPIEDLWCSEGSFTKLLNDGQSVTDRIDGQNARSLGLKDPRYPRSLLNGDRMYLKLLKAFYQIDNDDDISQPYFDEVDLFITMTDYWGIPVPIRLFDQLIHERRHRQNLHFIFRKDDKINDFREPNYSFLAYAARCTSSFPLAFAPMQLSTANRIIKRVKRQIDDFPANYITEDVWSRAFKPKTVQDAAGDEISVKWDKRVFVDGGYLDNKPFGYAIAALAQKQSDVLVERKLIYVEPNPDVDDSNERATRTTPPLSVENTLAALSYLPSYETIREDLQEVLQRNRLIARVHQIVTDARKDELESLRLSMTALDTIVQQYENLTRKLLDKYGDATPKSVEDTVKWDRLELGEIAEHKGQVAYPYYRLRIAALTDSLTRMVTHRAGYDEESDYFLAVRDLVYMWRKKRYSRGEEHDFRVPRQTVDTPTPMLFLRNYDFDYRMRRLRFALQQADRLLKFDPSVQRELEKTKNMAEALRNQTGADNEFTLNQKKALQNRFPLVEIEIYDSKTTPSEKVLQHSRDPKLHQTVRGFKKALNQILKDFRCDMRQVQPNALIDPDNENAGQINLLNERVTRIASELKAEDLRFLLGQEEGDRKQSASDGRAQYRFDDRNDLDARRRRAEQFLTEQEGFEKKLNEIGETLRTIYNGSDADISVFGKARKQVYELFDPTQAESDIQRRVRRQLGVGETDEIYLAVRAYLWHFYDNFDAYDQIIFPVTYETPIGEGVPIDVARISPLDARGLIDEQGEKQSASGRYEPRRKLAGASFNAFGAFFSADWRRNDLMWGKLDAVERLVSIVLSPNLVKKTSELKATALRNRLNTVRELLIDELSEFILRQKDHATNGSQAEGIVERSYQNYLRTDKGAREFDRLTEYVRKVYRIDRALDNRKVFEVTAGSLAILRKVFRKQEFGKFYRTKNFALDGMGLLIKPKREPGERRLLLKQLVAFPTWIYVPLGFVLATLLMSPPAVVALLIGSLQVFVIGSVAVILLGIGLLYVGNRVINSKWRRLQNFLQAFLYARVTGSDGKR